ncbi:MAG: maleylpyruvate isomerase family mycothiol-dependent enzyme [Lapillicoccus sp.]
MDAAQEWTRAQQRVVELVEGVDAGAAAQRVPACPDWTVRDLLSHVIGLGVDVVAGDEPDDHNEAWTARQVESRRSNDVAALLAEWRALTPAMQSYLQEVSPRPLNDLVIHEQDLRGALGVSGGRDTDGLAAVRERMLARFTPKVEGLPVIALDGESWSWRSGEGEPSVVVRASTFDLTRALTARRSEHQIRGWTVQGDIEPYLPAFATLGPLPERDLSE